MRLEPVAVTSCFSSFRKTYDLKGEEEVKEVLLLEDLVSPGFERLSLVEVYIDHLASFSTMLELGPESVALSCMWLVGS